MSMDVSSSRPSNKANIFLGLIEYELNSLRGAKHLVDYISVHIRFDLERYLLNINFRFVYAFLFQAIVATIRLQSRTDSPQLLFKESRIFHERLRQSCYGANSETC